MLWFILCSVMLEGGGTQPHSHAVDFRNVDTNIHECECECCELNCAWGVFLCWMRAATVVIHRDAIVVYSFKVSDTWPYILMYGRRALAEFSHIRMIQLDKNPQKFLTLAFPSRHNWTMCLCMYVRVSDCRSKVERAILMAFALSINSYSWMHSQHPQHKPQSETLTSG